MSSVSSSLVGCEKTDITTTTVDRVWGAGLVSASRFDLGVPFASCCPVLGLSIHLFEIATELGPRLLAFPVIIIGLIVRFHSIMRHRLLRCITEANVVVYST